MFCDKCGTPFVAGAQYCTSCGKPIVGAAAPPQPAAAFQVPPATRPWGDGRVRRHIQLLSALWFANGILRLLEVGSLLVFRRWLFDWGWWRPEWPFNIALGGLLFGGAAAAIFGVVHLVLAWGLYERQPWARMLGIVIGLLALIRIPFGTALGIYTLWVLLPEGSAREYDVLAGVGQAVNVAR